MKQLDQNVERNIIPFIDEIKDLLAPDVWQSLLLDCTKNEIMILWLLYRNSEVNMSQIAEYIHVPLNTATGVISRMEKRKLVIRERSEQDKRIVTLHLGELGRTQMQTMMGEFSYYGMQVAEAFTEDEIDLFFRMIKKFIEILKQDRKKESNRTRIKKITIE